MSSDASPPEPVWIPVTEMLGGPWLGRIRLALQRHRLDRVTGLLEPALSIVPVRLLLSVKLHVLQALVQHWQGHTRLALRTLQRACEAARVGGCSQALLEEGAMLDQVPGVEMDCAVLLPATSVHKALAPTPDSVPVLCMPQCVAALRRSLQIALACEPWRSLLFNNLPRTMPPFRQWVLHVCDLMAGQCTLPDGGPVDPVTGGHQNCRYACCISMLIPIWHALPFFAVDISSEKTEKRYVAEVR